MINLIIQIKRSLVLRLLFSVEMLNECLQVSLYSIKESIKREGLFASFYQKGACPLSGYIRRLVGSPYSFTPIFFNYYDSLYLVLYSSPFHYAMDKFTKTFMENCTNAAGHEPLLSKDILHKIT